jgi:hypothetical protein
LDGDSRRGALLHPLHAFTPDGTPLGTLSATAWTREEEPINASLSRAQVRPRRSKKRRVIVG